MSIRIQRTTAIAVLILTWVLGTAAVRAQEPPPELTEPVNDFAGVIDPGSRRQIEEMVRSLQQTTGDAVVVATIDTFAPYGDIREYAVRMFENHGRGIGERGRDNGVLVLLSVRDRQVWVEVGYDLEQFITDGFAGETSRQFMIPEFRNGRYGAGLLAGTQRIIGRIAEGRNVTLQGVRRPERARQNTGSGGSIIVALFILFLIVNAIAGRLHRRQRFSRRWGGGPWSGWHSGVGPFGGGGGFGGFGGGGFGGGFGGFGGGRSGGGGGGGGW